MPKLLGGCRYAFVLGLDHRAALAADQELPGVWVLRMPARDVSPGCFQPVRNSAVKQEVQAPIHASRRC